MNTIHFSRLWDDVTVVKEGDVVVDGAGRPLRLRTLIARCWGWPKSAAKTAAVQMELENEDWTLHLVGLDREMQQQGLLARCTGLASKLLEGLAGRSSRESRSDGRFDRLMIDLSEPVSDHGLISRILGDVGDHIGETSKDLLRDRCTFRKDGGTIGIGINLTGLDLE